MNARDPERTPDLESIDAALRRSLERLERDVVRAVDAAALGDGELGGVDLEQLDRRVAELEGSIGDIEAALHVARRRAPMDVGQIAAEVFERVLVDVEKPLLLSFDRGLHLPRPVGSASLVDAALHRLFEAALRAAANGDRIGIQLAGDGAGEAPGVMVGVTLVAADAAAAVRVLSDVLPAIADVAAGIVVDEVVHQGSEVRCRVRLRDAVAVA